MKRRSYSKEFKRQAIDLILIEGQPIRFIARTLDIHENTLYRWVAEYEKFGDQAFPGKGNSIIISQNKTKKLKKKI